MVLFRDEAQFCQLPLQQSGAEQLAGTDTDAALQQVVPAAEGILGRVKEQHKAIALIVLETVDPEPGSHHSHQGVDDNGDGGG